MIVKLKGPVGAEDATIKEIVHVKDARGRRVLPSASHWTVPTVALCVMVSGFVGSAPVLVSVTVRVAVSPCWRVPHSSVFGSAWRVVSILAVFRVVVAWKNMKANISAAIIMSV